MRKQSIAISLVLLMFLLASGSALASDRWIGHRGGGHWGHPRGHFGFGLYLGPPAVYYAPPSYYYPPPHRVWVPGYWDWRWSGYRWERAWIPGHRQWR